MKARGATNVPGPGAFSLRVGAYGLFLVVLWNLLGGAFDLLVRGWDEFVERPRVARQPGFEPDGCHLGIYRPEAPHTMDRIHAAESSLERRFSVVSIYQAWGSAGEHHFPYRELQVITNAGYVPMLTWEPWTSAFDEATYGPRSDRAFRPMRDVAAGRYDPYLQTWARRCMRWGRPLFLRFGHEMNNPRYPWSFATGNTAEDYRAAWRHVRGIFDTAGCRNVAWVWTPLPGPEFETYYPGDALVDWVGIAVLNYGLTSPPHRWRTFREILQPSYSRLAAFEKPMLLAEVGTVGGSTGQGDWLTDAVESLRSDFPGLCLLVWFDAPNDTTLVPGGVSWAFTHRPSILKRLKQSLDSDWFRSRTRLELR